MARAFDTPATGELLLGCLVPRLDATELEALFEDIQTEVLRCLYHVKLQRQERRAKQLKAKRAYRHHDRRRRLRGRPVDGVNLAAHQLRLALATIWANHTGRTPTRRFDPTTDRDCGPFWEFVAAIVDVVSESLQRRRKGHLPRIDTFVRASIKDFVQAQSARKEHRKRGLIDEGRWLRA